MTGGRRIGSGRSKYVTVSHVGTTGNSISAPASNARPQAPAATTHAPAVISSPSVLTRDRAATRLDAGYTPLVEDDGTCGDRAREERLIRPVGEGDAAVGVVEHRLAGSA